MKCNRPCSRYPILRAGAALSVLWGSAAFGGEEPLTCFASGQAPAAVIAACAAALSSPLPARTRALALSLRGEAWRQSGDAAKARTDLDAAVALLPDDPEIRLSRGKLNAQDNRAPDAEADFTVAILASVSRPELAGEAYALRGALRLKQGVTGPGIADLGEARRLAPTNPLPFKLRGEYFLAHGDPKAAVGELSEVLARSPDDLDARRARATAHAQLRDFAEAIGDFDALLAVAPQDEAALKGRGVAALQSGAFARAEQDLTAALAVKPSVETTFLRANTRLQSGAYGGAIEDFTAVLKQRRDDDEALFSRAMAYQFSGDFSRGEADLDAILARTPDAAEALSKRGAIRFMQGKFTAAAGDFARAAALPHAPGDVLIWRFLTDARAGQKTPPPSPPDDTWPAPVLRYFRVELSGDQLIAAAGSDPGRLCEIYFYLGEAAVLQGQSGEAVKLFTAARATGRTRYTEYAAAEAELARLTPPGP